METGIRDADRKQPVAVANPGRMDTILIVDRLIQGRMI